jgi:hypothetical protein
MEVKKWKAMLGVFFCLKSLSLSQKKTSTITNIRIQKLFVIGNYFFFYLTNKETAKDECVITFLHKLIFSGCHP